MGGTRSRRSGRRYRRARRLHADDRGVVAVIGTLLSLLVFFALFGIFLTQYVPIWMTENESAFTTSVATSFAQLKSNVDTQYVLDGPPTLGTPFSISSAGIPLIAQPTEGALSFIPSNCPAGFYAKGMSGATSANYGQPVNPTYCVFENQTIRPGFGGSGLISLEVSTGILNMILPNRYYTGETFVYEADGVIDSQTGGYQIMAYAPPLNATRIAGNTTVSSSFLQLYGNATTVIGTGTQEVYSHLRYTQEITYNGYNGTSHVLRAFNYTFEIGTQYPCSWWKFLSSQMNVSGVPTSQFTLSPSTYPGNCNNALGQTTDLTLTLTAVNYVNLFYAGVQISLGIGSA